MWQEGLPTHSSNPVKKLLLRNSKPGESFLPYAVLVYMWQGELPPHSNEPEERLLQSSSKSGQQVLQRTSKPPASPASPGQV